MTDRERQMIAAYLPNPPDPTLEEGEYYFKQSTMGGERIIRVFALDVLPYHDGTEYGLYQNYGGRMRWVDGYGLADRDRGVRKGKLYDNRQDCADDTHWFFDDWEELRKLERDPSSPD